MLYLHIVDIFFTGAFWNRESYKNDSVCGAWSRMGNELGEQ